MIHKNQFPEVVGHEAKDRKRSTSMYVVRLIVAVVVLLVSCTYIVAIVQGRLSALQKLGLADIAVFALAVGVASVMLRPELLDRISHFKFGELELDWLQKIEADQRKQRDELDAVRFVLTLLLQESELEHLRNLEKGSTQYQGNETVCAELRKLRTLGLIRNRKDHTIGEISAKRSFDLKDIVELTERGRQYLERLGEYAENE
jgi:hypothetical protein